MEIRIVSFVKVAFFCLSFLVLGSAHALDIYVSTQGSDKNSGQHGEPLASLAAAKEKARRLAGKETVRVHVADGTYYLDDTLVFTPADSGTHVAPVVYQAINEGGAVLSGGLALDLKWQVHTSGIYKAKTPKGLDIDQLFINGQKQRMARYPNFDENKKDEPYQGYAADAFSQARIATWDDPAGGYIHAMHRSSWGGYHYRITGVDASGYATYVGGWQNNRQMGMHDEFRMVENIFEELDAPSEWFHDKKTNTLFYMPPKEVDLDAAEVNVVRLSHIVHFDGTEQTPVKHIRFQGFVIRHAARTFMETKEPLLRSDWAIYRGGAFLLSGTEDIQIRDCEFDQVGGNAIFVSNYNRRVLVRGCHIHHTGGSGVAFVGHPDAVRDPLFEYNEVNDLSKIDLRVGPKSNNFPADSVVEDSLIHNIGTVERQTAGVQISMASNITVRDTSIYETSRAGINMSEGTWGGHLIDRVDVFDTVLETHDHGSFNSWGRDRFWRKDYTTTQAAVNENPRMPFLDAFETTTIRNSRWRCEHGWDVDLDDGSSNYDIYNNVMLSGGLKLREGFRRHVWNNIVVHSGLHPHVWYDASQDQVYSNIFSAAHKPARMKKKFTDGTMVDQNFYRADEARVKSISDPLGWDQNSLFGDPMFIDAEKGDFRVHEDSPAKKIGFRNFAMDQFGVKKASLRAMARTPSFGSNKSANKSRQRAGRNTTILWMGAILTGLTGNDFSAYGVSKADGGVAIVAREAESEAVLAGFQDNDLIQSINGSKVRTPKELIQVMKKNQDRPLTVAIVRNQQIMELRFKTATLPAFR